MANLLNNTKKELVDIILRKDDEYAKLVKENSHLKDDLTFAKNNYEVLVKEKETEIAALTDTIKQAEETQRDYEMLNNQYQTLNSNYRIINTNYKELYNEHIEAVKRHNQTLNKFHELEKLYNDETDKAIKLKNKNKTTNIILIMVIIALIIMNCF